MFFSDNEDTEYFVAHKKCIQRLEGNMKKYPGSEELPNFLSDLIHNSRVKPKDMGYSEERQVED